MLDSDRCTISTDEIISAAMKSAIEMKFLHSRAINLGWDIKGEADISGLAGRAEYAINGLLSEVKRMRECLLQIDEDAAQWHEKISKNVCMGAFPQHMTIQNKE